MTLCHFCAGIRFDDLFIGETIPWNRSIMELCSSAGTCELCTLIVESSDRKLLDERLNDTLYLVGGCNIETHEGDISEPRQIVTVHVYSSADNDARWANGHSSQLPLFLSASGEATSGDGNRKAEIATLSVVCGTLLN